MESVEAWRGYIDIWLADLKYVSSALSAELSSAPDYFAQAKPAIEAMMAQSGHPAFDAEGILHESFWLIPAGWLFVFLGASVVLVSVIGFVRLRKRGNKEED